MIVAGSRYTEQAETRNDSTVVVATPTQFSTNKFFTIVATSEDSFERLATRYLTGPQMWWKIADINKHVQFPDFIPTGTVIRIPMT